MNFRNREAAGHQLAARLKNLKASQPVVLALPRGGIVLGYQIARSLDAPLGLVMVRKLGHPQDPEYAIGAIVENQAPVLSSDIVHQDDRWLNSSLEAARDLLKKRQQLYFDQVSPAPNLHKKCVIIVDDGMATGLTMEAAVRSVRQQMPAKVVVATPVASPESLDRLAMLVDQFIIIIPPSQFLGSVGAHYDQFQQIDDNTVIQYLRQAANLITK